MKHELNLATRPFLNPRPVARVSMALWLLGILVAGFNVRLYLSHYSGSGSDRVREQELEARLSRERTAVQELEDELATYDVEWQNEQSDFLNTKIVERSFSWSVLFDRLGEVMPADVRLNTLSPSFSERRRSSRTEMLEGEVLLTIRGEAKSSEVLLEFIDALFGHPSFRAPDLSGESLQDGGLLDFGLTVVYRRAEEAPAVEEAVETSVEPGDPASETDTVEAAETEGPPAQAADDDEADTASAVTTEADTR